jgi:hypothetical protein
MSRAKSTRSRSGTLARRKAPSCTAVTLRGLCHALIVIDAERNALVVPEIELVKITVQVSLTDVVIYADDAALQDRKVVLDRVGMPEDCANIFLGTMIYAIVTAKVRQ